MIGWTEKEARKFAEEIWQRNVSPAQATSIDFKTLAVRSALSKGIAEYSRVYETTELQTRRRLYNRLVKYVVGTPQSPLRMPAEMFK